MKSTSRLCLVLAVVATAGLVAVPTAMGAQADTAVSKATLAKRIKNLKEFVVTHDTEHEATLNSVKNTVDAIVAGVPQITNGLKALETGLKTLGAAYQAVEYGALALYAGDAQQGELVSGDIPDDGNTAGVSGQIPVSATGATSLRLRAVIRSAEADGGETGDPAGQVGALMYIQCATGGGCVGGGVPAGVIGCTPAQTPARNFNIPDSEDESLTLVNIQKKVDRTEQDQPASSLSSDGNTDALGGATCNIPGSGTWIVFVNGQFVDIPTSSDPSGTD